MVKKVKPPKPVLAKRPKGHAITIHLEDDDLRHLDDRARLALSAGAATDIGAARSLVMRGLLIAAPRPGAGFLDDRFLADVDDADDDWDAGADTVVTEAPAAMKAPAGAAVVGRTALRVSIEIDAVMEDWSVGSEVDGRAAAALWAALRSHPDAVESALTVAALHEARLLDGWPELLDELYGDRADDVFREQLVRRVALSLPGEAGDYYRDMDDKGLFAESLHEFDRGLRARIRKASAERIPSLPFDDE